MKKYPGLSSWNSDKKGSGENENEYCILEM